MFRNLKHGRKIISVILSTVLLFMSVPSVFAADTAADAVSKANKWIEGNQDADGCWGSEDNYNELIACTSEISSYLKQKGISADAVSKAEAFLRGEGEEKTNNYFTAILAGIFDESYRKELVNTLAAAQKPDGGWGLTGFYESDVFDTTKILTTLIEENADINIIKKGIDYLLQAQKSDGSWSPVDSSNGNISLTAEVAILFNKFSTATGLSSSSLEAAMAKAGKYLLSKQGTDGTWGVDKSNIAVTLMAYTAVLLTDGTEHVGTLENSIIGLQNENGSWYDDAYITMLAAKALNKKGNIETARIKDIKLFTTASGSKIESYSYNPYEEFEINVESESDSADAKTFIFIRLPNNTKVSIPTNGTPSWNTLNNVHGEYSVEALIKDEKTGRVMASQEKKFTINEGFNLGNVLVSLNPHFTRVNKPTTVNAEVTVESHSNVDKSVEVRTSVYDGSTVVTSSNKTINFKASDLMPAAVAISFDPDVSAAKDYIIKSEVYDGENKVAEGQNTFKVLPADMQTYDFTLKQGEEVTKLLNVMIPDMPPKVDVVFSFGLTGSMGGILDTAKYKAKAMMSELNKLGVDINYGVVSYMDYNYGSYGGGRSYPYKLNCAVTGSISSVSDSINSLQLGDEGDSPEAYTRVLYESYADTNIGWRNGAKRILVNFGDSVPHDSNINEGVPGTSGVNNTGIDLGRDGVINTADDLDLQEVLKGMASNNVELIACQANGSYGEYWGYWAGLAGGKSYNTNSANLASEFVNAVKTSLAAQEVKDLKLVPSLGYDSWINNISPEGYSGKANTVVPFDVRIKVPIGTEKGMHSYKLDAIDNKGIKYGTYNFNIDVVTDEVAPTISTVVTTDKEQYLPDENVKILASAKNLTPSESDLKGKAEIVGTDGSTVKVLEDNIKMHWSAGETKNLNFEWNTEKTIAGKYKARIIWTDNDGKTVGSSYVEFAVSPDGQIKNNVSTDKASYNSDESVYIIEAITNTSKNYIMSDSIVKTTIQNTSGSAIWSVETPVAELLPGNTTRLSKTWNTAHSAAGSYTVTSTIYKAADDKTVLSSSTASFEILPAALSQGVVGKIEASPKIITPDKSVVLSRTLSNIGNTEINSVKRKVIISDPVTGNVIDSIIDTVALELSKTVSDSITWHKDGIKVGSYLVSYQAELPDGTNVALGSTGFKVENPAPSGGGISAGGASSGGTTTGGASGGGTSGGGTTTIPDDKIPIGAPVDIAISITADKTTYSEQEEIIFTVKYKNMLETGTQAFKITADIPENTEVSDTGDGKIEGKTITWQIPGFIGKGSGQRIYKVKVGNIPKNETVISDTAQIGGINGLINTEDDKSTVKVMLRTQKYGDISHKAYIKGYPGKEFRPENQITRAEAAAIFARTMGLTLTKSEKKVYSDVETTHWAEAYIKAAADAGVFKGYEDKSFHPEDKITRSELATAIARYLNVGNVKPFEEHYNDLKGHWAQNYIEEINRLKVIEGYEDGTFRPDLGIKRSEAVTMINKMLFRGPLKVDSSMFTDVETTCWFFGQVEEAAMDHKFTMKDGNEVLSH